MSTGSPGPVIAATKLSLSPERLRSGVSPALSLAGVTASLTLQHVGDPDRIETQRFSEIDPELPIVDEICLLSDRLQELLTLISGEDRDGTSVFDGHLYKEVA
jgi:hypothetical protein